MWVVLALSFLQCALADGWASIEAAHSVPKGWMQLDRHVPESQQIELHLYLKQRNVAELYQRFESISDPLSADYGRFLTQHELTALISPSTETLQLVEDWLRDANVDVELNSNLDIALCRTDVAGANRLVSGATWSYFQNEAGHTVVRSATPYLIPSRLVGHIDAIAGLRTFPPARPRNLAPRGTTSTGGISPAEIKKYFNMPANIAGTASSNLQAVAEFLEQYYAPSDLTTFQQNFKLPKQAVTKVDGPNVASNPGIEASLDIEYIMGVAPGVPTWFVYTPKLHDGQEPFAIWIYNIGNLTDPPLVHSVSYGDVEDSVLMEWAQRVDTEFVKLQSKGLSLLVSSGDDGAGCAGGKFDINWPACSPYVTSVGGITAGLSETTNSFDADSISTGGFSDYFGQQPWQAQLVQDYLGRSGLPPARFYNKTGRAVPDVASFSENVMVVVDGQLLPVGGTSCAAPVWAAVISLINDQRLQNNKQPLGFLNPLLYQTFSSTPTAFIDITAGSNSGGSCGNGAGFPAVPGWDAVTGLGAPNWPNLLQALLAA